LGIDYVRDSTEKSVVARFNNDWPAAPGVHWNAHVPQNVVASKAPAHWDGCANGRAKKSTVARRAVMVTSLGWLSRLITAKREVNVVVREDEGIKIFVPAS
jgi:hypothetical protein